MAALSLPTRFQILRELGQGGMGIVYEALDVDRGVRVALKTIRNPSADAIARFKLEFRALQDVNHPNLVSLGELVSHADRWFFTMELVDGPDVLSYVRGTAGAFDPTGKTLDAREPAADAPSSSHAAPTARPRTPFDEARLRSTLRQLAGAIAALHEAGMVHRDVKPSNVRVDATGRAVLIDFGLVLDLGADAAMSTRGFVGTPAYMAPEQGASGRVGPEADWYALGAVLYEALTGVAPFEGAPLEILLRKQQEEPRAPSTIVAGAPADLEELCVALLRFQPSARPKAAQILRVLGAEGSDRARARSSTQQTPFIGRSRELDALAAARLSAHAGRAGVVVVRGESGVGKSCLVRRFVETCAFENAKLTVFAGRCYEREAVPYKAFDGVVDALTRMLLRLPPGETAAFFPLRTEALASVFPVLGRVPGFRRPAFQPLNINPHELRLRAFAALREMLVRIADRYPVVVVIDDIQWADADSLALLADILRPPEAPPLLLIATMRVGAEGERNEATEALKGALPADARMIDVGRLATDEARNLARVLLERWRPGAEGEAELIADGAGGHPLFIDALVHHRAVRGETSGPLRLDDALWARVTTLDAPARLLIERLAVAGAPMRQDALVAAGGDERAGDFSRTVSMLRVAHIVSISGGRAVDAIELYHDRIRTAVLAHLDAGTIATHHRALAVALERVGAPDPEALAVHWRGAGETDAAAKYADAAGTASANALAFDRAAEWYETAIELGSPAGEVARSLNERLGDALANGGRGARAAAAYRRAAVGANAASKLDLQRRAADQLIRGGHFEEGLDALRAVLAIVGMKLPATSLLALLSLLWWRLWIRMRGLAFERRDPTDIAASELTKVDTCWSVSFGLAMVDNIRGAAFQARHLALALATGELRRVHRALAIDMPYIARSGVRATAHVDALAELTDQLTLEIAEPYAVGFRFCALALAQQLLGRFRAALDAGDSAELFLRDCAGTAYELANARIFAVTSLARLGMMRELCRRQPIYVRDAVERGDVYAEVQFSVGHASWRWIVEDKVAEGRAEATRAMKVWSGRSYQVEHYYELIAQTMFDLYEGDAARAHERIVAQWAPLRGSLLLLVQAARVQMKYMRAHTAIVLARETPEGARRAGLLAAAARDTRALGREGAPWALAFAKVARAGLEAAKGRDANDARLVSLLRDAIAESEAAGMALNAAGARRALGQVLGGDEGAAMVRAADAWMRAETIVSPERVAALIVPGFAKGA